MSVGYLRVAQAEEKYMVIDKIAIPSENMRLKTKRKKLSHSCQTSNTRTNYTMKLKPKYQKLSL